MSRLEKINEPYYLYNQLVQMTKGYTCDISGDKPVHTANMFEYMGHFYDVHHLVDPKIDLNIL